LAALDKEISLKKIAVVNEAKKFKEAIWNLYNLSELKDFLRRKETVSAPSTPAATSQ